MEIKKVTVIGGGTMGRQIALNAAINGFDTTVNDSLPGVLDKVDAWSREFLAGRVAKGKMTDGQAAEVSARFHMEADLAKAAADADLVIEAVIEDLQVKRELFARLDELCPPRTILASNSSTFFPSQYNGATKRPNKVIGAHYFNPALVMQLIEVVLSDQTDEDTVQTLQAYGAAVKKKVIVVRKEIEGFVVNNLFGGVCQAAWDLLEGGYATVEDIDTAAEKGLGHAMGPFRTMDSSGLDTIYNVRMSRHQIDPEKHPAPSPILEEMVKKGELGVKTGKGFYDYSKK